MDPVSTLRSVLMGVVGDDRLFDPPEWLPANVPVWVTDIIASILVIILAWVVARLLVRLFGRRIAQHMQRPSLTRVALGGIKVGVYAFALLTILRINGLDLGNIALSVTVFSAVVGVILAPIVGNTISGIFLLADQPYEIGDMIEISDRDTRGFVEDITLRYTKMFTLENTFIVIPNGEMRERDVVNYSAEDTRVRNRLEVLITYESDIERAREVMEREARGVDRVIGGGPRIRIGGARYQAGPQSYIDEFADDGILLSLRYWLREPYRMHTIRSDIQERIWEAFEDEPVEIAYPHQHLVFDETSGALDISVGEQSLGTGSDGVTPDDRPDDPPGE